MQKNWKPNPHSSKEDQEIQRRLIMRANYSLVILGEYLGRASGRFVNIRTLSVPYPHESNTTKSRKKRVAKAA